MFDQYCTHICSLETRDMRYINRGITHLVGTFIYVRYAVESKDNQVW